MRKLFFQFAFSLFTTVLIAQPNIEWQNTYSNSPNGYFDINMALTNDNGNIVIGCIDMLGDPIVSLQRQDFWVIKSDATGVIEWEKSYGGSAADLGHSIQQTTDGGYIMAGMTMSNDLDVSNNHGARDCWIVKLSPTGSIQWQKTFGGSMDDEATSILQTTDGGFIVAGQSQSSDGDVLENKGSHDFWIIKLSEQGLIQWQKTLGGSKSDRAIEVLQTMDNGYAVMGRIQSTNGDVSGFHGGFEDTWLVKLDDNGNVLWKNAYGGNYSDLMRAFQQTSDGGFIMAGYSESTDFSTTEHHGGVYDCWVMKINALGEIEWQKLMGGTGKEKFTSVLIPTDGGYLLVGGSESIDGDISGNHGDDDSWIVKLNSNGDIAWQKLIGGSKSDFFVKVLQTSDKGFLLLGQTGSVDGDLTGLPTHSAYWILKLSPEVVSIQETPSNAIGYLKIFPNPSGQMISLSIVDEETILNVRISDTKGQLLLQQTIPNHANMELSTLPNGIYTVIATMPSGKVFSSKISKQE